MSNKDTLHEIEKLQEEMASLSIENDDLNSDLSAYTVLVNNKDKYSMVLEQELRNRADRVQILEQDLVNKEKYIEELLQGLNNKDGYIKELEEVLAYYQNLRVVKARAYIVRILKGVLRRIRRIINKGE